MTEEEFEKEVINAFDDRYHFDIKFSSLDKAENDERYWVNFKEYLRDVSNELYDPRFEGSYIRLLFRDFLYNNYPFEESDMEK